MWLRSLICCHSLSSGQMEQLQPIPAEDSLPEFNLHLLPEATPTTSLETGWVYIVLKWFNLCQEVWVVVYTFQMLTAVFKSKVACLLESSLTTPKPLQVKYFLIPWYITVWMTESLHPQHLTWNNWLRENITWSDLFHHDFVFILLPTELLRPSVIHIP